VIKVFLSFAENTSKEPAFYSGHFLIDKSSQVKDTFLSFKNWGKGIVFVNDFNLGRYWPVKFNIRLSIYVNFFFQILIYGSLK
jgi:beta-galactosidase